MSSRGALSAIHGLFLICQLLSVFIVIFPHCKWSKMSFSVGMTSPALDWFTGLPSWSCHFGVTSLFDQS